MKKEEIKYKNNLSWILYYLKDQRFILIFVILQTILLSAITAAIALVSQKVIDNALNHNTQSFIIYCVSLFIMLTLQYLIRIHANYQVEKVTGKMCISIKTSLSTKILNKQYLSVSQFHSADFMNRLFNDITIITGFVVLLVGLSSAVSRLLFFVIILIYFDWRFTLLLVAACLIAYFMIKKIKKKVKANHKAVQYADGLVRTHLQEVLESIFLIKAFGVEKKTIQHSAELQDIHYAQRLSRKRIELIANNGLSFLFSVGYIIGIIWCSARLSFGTITVGMLVAVISILQQIQAPFSTISGIIPTYYNIVASVERLRDIEQLPDEDNSHISFDGSQFQKIILEHIWFSYDNEPVFSDMNLTVCQSDFIAILGPSGIGKSTLFKLLLGLLDKYKGTAEIFTDTCRTKITASTRSLFSYVPQVNILFAGKIKDNLLFSDASVSDVEINKVLKLCCCSFIDDLPDGIDTIIGEKGTGLSEGQLQRLSIARALLTKKPVLLLDESTSALDPVTEQELLSNLKTIPNLTLLMITHKNPDTAIFNKIFCVDRPTIVSDCKE